jgi:hypothetical protein
MPVACRLIDMGIYSKPTKRLNTMLVLPYPDIMHYWPITDIFTACSSKGRHKTNLNYTKTNPIA